MIDDRLARGLLAGAAGGVAMNAVNLALYYSGLSQFRLLDWAGYTIYNFRPRTLSEAIFALMTQIIFVSILGIVFAYLIPIYSSRYYLLRGWVFGMSVWFIIYAFTLALEIEEVTPIYLKTNVTEFISASMYGLVLSWVMAIMDRRNIHSC